jgi:peptidoglycan/xylan/chitin deacetylase (PgdA/CDA1 family)
MSIKESFVILLFLLPLFIGIIDSQQTQQHQHIDKQTISLAFSDGHKSYIRVAEILHELNFNATFYINTNNITFQSEFLNVFDINILVDMGFEIGGHTKSHLSFLNPKIDTPTILEEICRDRAQLKANGWTPKSFAYADDFYKRQTQQIAEECGYNSALVGEPFGYINTTFDNPYNVNLPLIHALEISKNITAAYLLSFLNLNLHLDWIVYHFHITPPEKELKEFLNFIKQSVQEGDVIIQSIDQVIGGRFKRIPEEFSDTLPTETPDPLANLKIYIGTACLGALILLVFYVIITTRLKRTTKCKPCC